MRVGAASCANHPQREAVTRCASCNRWLCHACWRRRVGGEPWCELCIFHLVSKGSRLALAIAFFLIVLSVVWVGVHLELRNGRVELWPWWLAIGAGGVAGTLWLALRQPPEPPEVTERAPHEAPDPAYQPGRGHPYRAALRRASRLVASPVSGLKTSLVVMLSMAVVGLALPGLLHLPRLVEFDLVVLGFWLLWGVTGTLLLYRGFRVADDHVLAPPALLWDFERAGSKPEKRGRSGFWDGCGYGCFDIEFLVPLGVLFAAFVLAWALIEVVLPALFFLAYLTVRSALAAVANDEHDCQGHLGRALGWGFAWSTVFVLPFAGTLALVHALAP